ncbi:MAG: type I 3-dehydroquinate dehydratase, partial [Pyrinomonadaceae bacterium]
MNNGKICVSVCAGTADEMVANIGRAEEFADVIEVRFDCLDRDEISNFKFQISDLRFEKPLLATYRSADQGGKSDASLSEREQFWASIGSDLWAVDLEEDVLGSRPDSVVRLMSHHDFNGVPDDLNAVYSRLAASDCDVVKLAVTADDIVDTIPVWKLIEKAKAAGKDIIPIAMGDAGKFTRILGLAHGAFLTY